MVRETKTKQKKTAFPMLEEVPGETLWLKKKSINKDPTNYAYSLLL